jgi:hypothetical protein
MIALDLLFLVVYAINLIPGFAPPTWAVLTFFGEYSHHQRAVSRNRGRRGCDAWQSYSG